MIIPDNAIIDDGGMVPDDYSNMVNPEEDTFNDPGTIYKPKLRENKHLYEERDEADSNDPD